jgi:hypothetical protein
MPIDAAQHDLTEGDQATEQRDGRRLGVERRLRLRPTSESRFRFSSVFVVRNVFHIAFGRTKCFGGASNADPIRRPSTEVLSTRPFALRSTRAASVRSVSSTIR